MTLTLILALSPYLKMTRVETNLFVFLSHSLAGPHRRPSHSARARGDPTPWGRSRVRVRVRVRGRGRLS